MITISHPEKILFPDDGITKGEMAAYYEAIAPVMLPHLKGRPATMERFHRGIGEEGFFQKSLAKKGSPDWLDRVEVPKKGGTVTHPVVNDERSLLWLANQNCITPHVWVSRVPSLQYPDICIFDVRMPGRSGVEALQHMRERGDNRPVVLLTAALEDRALLAAVRAGVNGIVLKDVAEEGLLDTLRKVESGQRSVPEDLLQRALDLSLTGGVPDPLAPLAPRERQIAFHVGRGMRNREIADALAMSEGTVKVYLHTIYQKLGVKNRTELALIAHKLEEDGDVEGKTRAPSLRQA